MESLSKVNAVANLYGKEEGLKKMESGEVLVGCLDHLQWDWMGDGRGCIGRS